MRLVPILLLAYCLVFAGQALACSCLPPTAESGQNLIDEALYIGKVKIIKIEGVKDAFPEKVTLDYTAPYTKPAPESTVIDNNPSEASCGYGPIQEGEEYEVIILEREDGSRLIAGICSSLLPQQWESLRNEQQHK